jgi:hypothetical protein
MALLFLIFPGTSSLMACACGCQIFDTGFSGMPSMEFPNQLTFEYSFMNQNEDQSGSALTNPALNPDKQIETSFYTLTYSHDFNHTWGVDVEIPFFQRYFVTDNNGTPGETDADVGVAPDIESAQVNTLSDIKVMGMYTGISEDMSIGLTFGLKLPTGPFEANALLDRDTEPGTGTTDLLIGAFDRGGFTTNLGWYAQTLLDAPLYERDGYQPGNNLDVTAGLHYDGIRRWTTLTPVLQANVSMRTHDSGGGDGLVTTASGIQETNPDSGYENLYITPGLRSAITPQVLATVLIYLPVTRNVNGDQLVAPWLLHAELSYLF